jgi:PKD repeat protein
MKYLLTSLLLLFSTFIFSQAWFENDPDQRTDKRYTLPEYQQMFEDYWDGKEIEMGYYFENGKKQKAHGWKQFKRWEHFWESRVNNDGSFPNQRQRDVAQNQYESSKSRSSLGDWINLGPSNSKGGYAGVGRINQIAFHPNDPNTFWVTTPQGGLWTTEDAGQNWRPLTEEVDNLTCSAVAIPSDFAVSQTIYLGTGEMDSWQYDNGIGLLKSTDGGESWQSTGLTFDVTESISVNRLLIHPNDDSFIYAGTTNGIYLSEDAGESWVKIYDEDYISDMEFNPIDPSVVYASNKFWGRIYKLSNDGQDIRMIENLYQEGGRRVELSVSPSMPNIIYAVVSNAEGGLKSILKSSDSGESFQSVFVSEESSSKPNLLTWSFTGEDEGGQGDYDLALVVDPNDHNTLYVGGVNTWRSKDGGVTWQIVNYWAGSGGSGVQTVHADKHFFRYDGDILYECNDGGLYRSVNGSDWDYISKGIRNSQIYKIGVAQSAKNDVIAGLQDNGTKSFVNGNWYDVIGGDGMDCMIDHKNADIQYGELYYGSLKRTQNHWNNRKDITPEDADGAWITPLAMDPMDPAIIYGGYQHIYKSTDRGDNWEIIYELGSSSRFRTLVIAPSAAEVIYAGEPKKLWKTTDGGGNWEEVTNNLPNQTITAIAVKHDDPSTLWVTLGGYNAHGIYESIDGGKTWTNISTGIPNIPVNTIVQNAQNDEILELYVGTDFGIYFRLGNGNWTLFNKNMPKVVVTDLEIYYEEIAANSLLWAATYGRGLWASDLYSIEAAPVADFEADETNISIGQTVNFTDLTAFSPFTWNWEFEGGSPAVSSDINPSVSYNEAGSFDVKLIVSNGTGRDTIIREDYIVVTCDQRLNYLADKVQNEVRTYEDLGDQGVEILLANLDDANSEAIDIGFEFEYNCERFSQFILNSNGFIKLGDTPPSSAALYFDAPNNNENGAFSSEDTADQYLIAPFNHDLVGDEDTEFRVHLSGDAPGRVCSIQFKKLRDKEGANDAQLDQIEFQIKLYESTNIIEFIYGEWLSTSNESQFKTAACGLKGSGTDPEDVLLVSKTSDSPWAESTFDNEPYIPGEHGFNFSNAAGSLPENGRLFRFVPRYFEDLSVQEIYIQRKSPGEFGNPENIQAVIRNRGFNDMHDVPVTLSINGSNTFETTTVVDVVPAEQDVVATFDAFQPNAYGMNQIEVSVPDDAFNEDNTLETEQEITLAVYSYTADDFVDSAFGFPLNDGGIFANLYPLNGNAKMLAVSAYIFDDPANIGQEVFGVLLNQEGEVTAKSDTLLIEEIHLGSWLTLALRESPILMNEYFYAGIACLPSNNGQTYILLGAQKQIPSRANTYFNSDLSGGNLSARDQHFNYKYMINATVEPLMWTEGTASTNDPIVCSGDKGSVTVSVKPSGMHWEVSSNGLGGWEDPVGGFGASNKSYLTDNLFEDQYFRIRVPHDDGYYLHSNVVKIEVAPVYQIDINDIICQGDSYLFPDGTLLENIQENITQSSNLSTSMGCDSTIVSKLEVLPASYDLQIDSICAGEDYVFSDGTIWSNITQDTLYEMVFPLSNGCDSILATELLVKKVETGVMESDSSLMAVLAEASYQWIDCENGYSAIEGATNREFIPDRSGIFALVVDNGECIDTSGCIVFIHSTTKDLSGDGITVYPNPTTGKLSILSKNHQITALRVLDATGREVRTTEALKTKSHSFNIDYLPQGIYFLEIITSQGSELKKLILE